jgi:predicted nucleotidyltransferase
MANPENRANNPRRRMAERPSLRRSVAPRVLKDIIARVVAAARPERIILFGSAARGTMGPNSDVDLLVIKGGRFDRRKLTTAIYHHLFGAEAAVDVVVVTPDEVERYRDTPCLVIYPALREGRVVYGA